LLQMASCSSLQTGHQLSAIQIATSKWKLASGQPTQAVFMHNTDFLLWTAGYGQAIMRRVSEINGATYLTLFETDGAYEKRKGDKTA